MKTEYKWIRFDKIPNPGKKTSRWDCMNTSEQLLGYVYWRNGWRQYVYESDSLCNIEYNNGCLRDIANFLDQLNILQKLKN